MKPLGDAFIRAITMIITLIIFCTVVTGIAGMENLKKVGRIGGMALILGIDRFMNMFRALVNMIGKGLATLVLARWDGELDRRTLTRNLTRTQFR